MSMGADAGTALNAIARSQFDYGELTRNERAIKMVIPFYTWTRKNIPYQFSQLWRQPGKYNSLYSAKRVLEDRSEEEELGAFVFHGSVWSEVAVRYRREQKLILFPIFRSLTCLSSAVMTATLVLILAVKC